MNLGNRSIFGFLVWLCLTWPLIAFGEKAETKTFVAYSMKVAQSRVEQAVKTGEDFRKKQPDLYYLGGITKPWAIVIDANDGDWILVGERDPKSSVLTLDDWVVALRARFIHSERDPGVTIDPRPCEECLKAGKKEGCSHYTKQDVRFFGGIENTHFGQVCFEADWLMKKIGLGLERLPIEKLKTYYDLSVEQHRNTGAHSSNVGSRFWFYPIVNRVNVFSDMVLLEKFQMGVFTEVLYAEVDGKPVAEIDKFEHYPSEGFSRSFSENYNAAAEVREVLETLRGLTRLTALAKGLTQVEQKLPISMLLSGYFTERINTPKEKEVLAVENHDIGFQFRGGVDLMALAMRIRGGDSSAFRKLVLDTRPLANTISWEFTTEWQDGQLKGIVLPQGTTDYAQATELFLQGCFLHEKKRYDDAIECFDTLIQRCPELSVEVLWAKAIVLREYGLSTAVGLDNKPGSLGEDRIRQAIALFEKCIITRPNFAPGHYELAVTLRAFGETDKAIREFEKACQSDPNYPDPYYGLGTAWKDKGDFQRAIDFYSQYLTHDSKGSFAGEARQLINELKQRQLAQRSTLTEEGHSSKTYRDREGRFSFDYPGNWAVLTRDELSAKTKGIITEANPNLVLAIGNPDDWDENATLQINPGALGTQNPDKEQIDELAKLMDEEMPVYCKDFMKVSHRVFQLDGAPALEYIMVNTRMNVWFQSKEILVFKRDRTLILTCTAKMETFGKIDECCFQTIIKSLQAQ